MIKKIKDLARSPAVKLVVYFVSLAVVLIFLAWLFPWSRRLLLSGQVGPQGIPGLTDGLPVSSPGEIAGTFAQQLTQTAFIALLTLMGALIFTAPVVWIYTVILRQEGYDRSFVRMLVTLPVVVAGVVQVVQGDLALAFALAGIVAAVRFRTTVKDLQNAVFAFAGIGIGLATGTGAFVLAGAISAVVSFLFFVAWRFNIGDVEPQFELVSTGGSLAEALVPGETHRAVAVGDKSAVKPVQAADLDDLTHYMERLADYVRADALRKKKKYRELLLVYTSHPDEARKHVEEVLEDYATRWVEVDLISMDGEHDIEVVEYLIRLKKTVKIGELTDLLQFEDGDPIRAVELKPIKGLRKQLT